MDFYIKTTGMLCVVTAGIVGGVYASRKYAQRVGLIESMIGALEIMRAEISLRLTPMECIFEKLAEQNGGCREFFEALRLRIGEGIPLSDIWREEAARCFGESAEAKVFSELGASLGGYDAQSECGAIAYTLERLKQELAAARDECAKKGVLTKRLGITSGVAAAIILL